MIHYAQLICVLSFIYRLYLTPPRLPPHLSRKGVNTTPQHIIFLEASAVLKSIKNPWQFRYPASVIISEDALNPLM